MHQAFVPILSMGQVEAQGKVQEPVSAVQDQQQPEIQLLGTYWQSSQSQI